MASMISGPMPSPCATVNGCSLPSLSLPRSVSDKRESLAETASPPNPTEDDASRIEGTKNHAEKGSETSACLGLRGYVCLSRPFAEASVQRHRNREHASASRPPPRRGRRPMRLGELEAAALRRSRRASSSNRIVTAGSGTRASRLTTMASSVTAISVAVIRRPDRLCTFTRDPSGMRGRHRCAASPSASWPSRCDAAAMLSDRTQAVSRVP